MVSKPADLAGEVSDREFHFATVEYQEVCQNIRESWTYIITLVRQFLVIQVVLLSLVGLGNSTVSTLTSIPNGATQTGASSSSAEVSSTEKDRFAKEVASRRLIRYGVIITALMIIGGVFSWGALLQSRRIFFNAQNFVARAAAIEDAYGVGVLDQNPSLHNYMQARLDHRELFQMRGFLSGIYFSGICLWVIIGVIFALPYIAYWI